MDDLYKALGHPVRRKILQLLRRRAHSAGELAEEFEIAKPTLSGHLNILKNADLVTVERRATTLIYRLNMSVAEELIENVLGLLNITATDATDRTAQPAETETKDD